MAIFRLSVQIIGRSQGRSATAAAAYRAAERIEDARTGQVFDYGRKRGVLHSEVLAPENAPDWMSDRAQLWNAVERVEKRKDAQLAREVLLALPHELTPAQRIELVREFVREEFVAKGMIADVTVHAPDRQADERNYHAHVLLTTRELTGDGFGKKCRDWNPDFGRAAGEGGFVRQAPQLEQWREHWADSVNRTLERYGHEARVDHRSLAEQGIDREPEPKQGPVATAMEREGRPSHAGDDRRAVQELNEERARLAPEVTADTIGMTVVREAGANDNRQPAPERPPEQIRRDGPPPASAPKDNSPALTGGDSILAFGIDLLSETVQNTLYIGKEVGREHGSDRASLPPPASAPKDNSPALTGGDSILAFGLDLLSETLHNLVDLTKEAGRAIADIAGSVVGPRQEKPAQHDEPVREERATDRAAEEARYQKLLDQIARDDAHRREEERVREQEERWRRERERDYGRDR